MSAARSPSIAALSPAAHVGWREAGLEAVSCRSLTFGAAWVHAGRVPGGA
jgi:hypothetical protein